MHGDGARLHGKAQGGDRGKRAITVHGKGQGQRAITVHGDGARVAREGAGRGPKQRAITVHGDGARLHGKVQGGHRGRER